MVVQEKAQPFHLTYNENSLCPLKAPLSLIPCPAYTLQLRKVVCLWDSHKPLMPPWWKKICEGPHSPLVHGLVLGRRTWNFSKFGYQFSLPATFHQNLCTGNVFCTFPKVVPISRFCTSRLSFVQAQAQCLRFPVRRAGAAWCSHCLSEKHHFSHASFGNLMQTTLVSTIINGQAFHTTVMQAFS